MKLQYNWILLLLLVGLHVREDHLTYAEETSLKREVENVDNTEHPNNYDSLENAGILHAGNTTADCSLIISCMSTNSKNVEREYHRRMKRCGKLLKSYSKQIHQTGQVTNYERSTDEHMKLSSDSSFYKNKSDTSTNLHNEVVGKPQRWMGRANVKLSHDFQLIKSTAQDVSTKMVETETLQRFGKSHSRIGTDRLRGTTKNTVFETASISKENRTLSDNHRTTSNTQDNENPDQNTKISLSVNPKHDQKKPKGIIRNMFSQIKNVMEGGSYKELSPKNGSRTGDLARHPKETIQTSSGMSEVQLYKTDGWRLTTGNKLFLRTPEKNTTKATPTRIKVITAKPTKISQTTPAVYGGHPNSSNVQAKISDSHVRSQQFSPTNTNPLVRSHSILTSKTMPQKLYTDTILTGSKSNFVTQKTKTDEDFNTLAIDQNLTRAPTMRIDTRTSDSLIPAGFPDQFSTFQNAPITPFVSEFSVTVTQPTRNADYTQINSSAVKSGSRVDNQEPENNADENSTQTTILKFISNNPLHSIATAVKQEPHISEELEYEEYAGVLNVSTRDSTGTSKLPAKTTTQINESANMSERIRPLEDDFTITALPPLLSSVSDYWTITKPTSAADMTSRLAAPKSELNRVVQEFDNGFMNTLHADSEILPKTMITPNDSLELFETASIITQSMSTTDDVNDTRVTEESRFDLNAQEFQSGHPEIRIKTSISPMGAQGSTETADISMPASSHHQNHTASSILFSSPSIFDFSTTPIPITLLYKTSVNSESSSMESVSHLRTQESVQNVTMETLDVSNNSPQTFVSNELFGSSTPYSISTTTEPSSISSTVLTLYLDTEQQEATSNDNSHTPDSSIGRNHLVLTSSAPSEELNALTMENNSHPPISSTELDHIARAENLLSRQVSAINQLDSFSAPEMSNPDVNEHVRGMLRTILPGVGTLLVSTGDPMPSASSFERGDSVFPANSHGVIEPTINETLGITENPNIVEVVSHSFITNQESIFKSLPSSNQQIPNQPSISEEEPIISTQKRDHTSFLTTQHRQIPLEPETQQLIQTYDSAKRKENRKEISVGAKEPSTVTSLGDLVAVWSTATPIFPAPSAMHQEKYIDAVAVTEDVQSFPIVNLPKTTALRSDFNKEPTHPNGISESLFTTPSGRLSPSSRVQQFDTIVGREKINQASLAIESRKSDISDANPDMQFTALSSTNSTAGKYTAGVSSAEWSLIVSPVAGKSPQLPIIFDDSATWKGRAQVTQKPAPLPLTEIPELSTASRDTTDQWKYSTASASVISDVSKINLTIHFSPDDQPSTTLELKHYRPSGINFHSVHPFVTANRNSTADEPSLVSQFDSEVTDQDPQRWSSLPSLNLKLPPMNPNDNWEVNEDDEYLISPPGDTPEVSGPETIEHRASEKLVHPHTNDAQLENFRTANLPEAVESLSKESVLPAMLTSDGDSEPENSLQKSLNVPYHNTIEQNEEELSSKDQSCNSTYCSYSEMKDSHKSNIRHSFTNGTDKFGYNPTNEGQHMRQSAGTSQLRVLSSELDAFNHLKVGEQTAVQYQSHSLPSNLNYQQNESISQVNSTIFGRNPASVGKSMSFIDWWNKTQKVKPELSSTAPPDTDKRISFIDWWNSTQKVRPALSSTARDTNKHCQNIFIIGESNARLLKAILKSLHEEEDDEADSSSSETGLKIGESDLKINRSNKRDLKNQQPFLKINLPTSTKSFDNSEPNASQVDSDEELLRKYFHFIDPEVFKNFMNVYKQYQPESKSVRSKSLKTKKSRIAGQRKIASEPDNTITNTLQELVRLRSSIPKALIKPNTPNPQLYFD